MASSVSPRWSACAHGSAARVRSARCVRCGRERMRSSGAPSQAVERRSPDHRRALTRSRRAGPRGRPPRPR
eukprot:3496449-Prymnesium_polylepis.1